MTKHSRNDPSPVGSLSDSKPELVLGRLLRTVGAEEAIRENADAFLDQHTVDPLIRDSLLSKGDKRLLAYFRLVHNRIHNIVKAYLPRTFARLPNGRLRKEIVRFLAEKGPQSPYFRAVPREAILWLIEGWKHDSSVPEYLHELALYELTDDDLRGDPNEIGETSDSALDLEAPILCNGTLRIQRFEYAVHSVPLPKAGNELESPAKNKVTLLSYRTRAHKVKHLVIKERSGFLIERLQKGQNLREALVGACQDSGEQLSDELLATTAVTLADLIDKEVLLGPGSSSSS